MVYPILSSGSNSVAHDHLPELDYIGFFIRLGLQHCGLEVINQDLGAILCLHYLIVLFDLGVSHHMFVPIVAHDLVKTSKIL